MQTDTTGAELCNDLFAKVEVFNADSDVVHTEDLDTTALLPYALNDEGTSDS